MSSFCLGILPYCVYLTKGCNDQASDITDLNPCSVVVHSGGVNGGHYYCYVRNSADQWVKLDDDIVTLVSEEEAVQMNYGGSDGLPRDKLQRRSTGWSRYRTSNAYMLVYIRACDVVETMKGDIAVPPALIQRFHEEKVEAERREKELEEASKWIVLKLFTMASFLSVRVFAYCMLTY